MTGTVHCDIHGEQPKTLVCRHLATSLQSGEHVGFYYSDGERGDAWCAQCDVVRIREGDDTGAWSERSEVFVDIQILCGACYDRVRALQGN